MLPAQKILVAITISINWSFDILEACTMLKVNNYHLIVYIALLKMFNISNNIEKTVLAQNDQC